LSKLYNYQRTQANFWGINTLSISDVQRGDTGSGSQIAFARHAAITWAEDANINEWAFVGNWLQSLGTGAPTAF